MGRGYPFPLIERYASSQKKKFHLKWRVLVHAKRYFFVRVLAKNVEFSASSGDLGDNEDVVLGNSE